MAVREQDWRAKPPRQGPQGKAPKARLEGKARGQGSRARLEGKTCGQTSMGGGRGEGKCGHFGRWMDRVDRVAISSADRGWRIVGYLTGIGGGCDVTTANNNNQSTTVTWRQAARPLARKSRHAASAAGKDAKNGGKVREMRNGKNANFGNDFWRARAAAKMADADDVLLPALTHASWRSRPRRRRRENHKNNFSTKQDKQNQKAKLLFNFRLAARGSTTGQKMRFSPILLGILHDSSWHSFSARRSQKEKQHRFKLEMCPQRTTHHASPQLEPTKINKATGGMLRRSFLFFFPFFLRFLTKTPNYSKRFKFRNAAPQPHNSINKTSKIPPPPRPFPSGFHSKSLPNISKKK